MGMDEGQPRSAPPRADRVISEERFQRYHDYARRRGVNRLIYAVARLILQPAFWIWLRLSKTGRAHFRGIKGGLVVASNHRSFLDPFAIGVRLPWRRPMQYVAKVELFERRWQGWLLSRLGAFPIRRGQSDDIAMGTAGLVLDRGGTVCIFPEGTRIRSGSLATPRRGVGRLALESGAAVVPVAAHGTEHVRRGWRIRPRKVKLRIGRPMDFPRPEHPSPALAATVTSRIWPNIELQWEWLGGLPPLRKAAGVGAGSWGTAIAVLLARGGLEVQLGTRSAEKAAELAQRRVNDRYLPDVTLPEGIVVRRAADIELGACDLICLAVPSAALPAVVGSLADRVGSRAAVLLLSKGLVQPLGLQPYEYVSQRIRARAIASLGGPALAREAVAGIAALVLAGPDADLRDQLGEVFDRAGLVCERTDDVIGVEVAGAAKNAAALAAAAAASHGLNAAGIADAQIWRECVDFGLAPGARVETFSGLAGVGDLTATVLAPSSRNRQAGELLGNGVPADQIPGRIGQASESLDSVPLLAAAIKGAGVDAPGLDGLAALIAGRLTADDWVAGLRRAERERQAA